MPVFNSGEYLKKAVFSILDNKLQEIELILVDDGSTDGSSEQCEELAQKDNRIRVIHQENGGICRARNSALKIAKGEYIGFSDHDDTFEHGVWNKCIDVINQYNRPDMIKFGKNYIFVDSKGSITKTITIEHQDGLFSRDTLIKDYLLFRQQSVFRFVWDGLYKREIIEQNNIRFDPYFTHGGEDHDFCNTFSRYIKTFATIKETYYNHFMRAGFSTSSKRNSNPYYLTEGERLLQTLKTIQYDIQSNEPLYWNEIFVSCILPILRDHIKYGVKAHDTIRELSNINNLSFLQISTKVSLSSLIKQSKKIGLFSYLFIKKHYKSLYLITRLRYAF